MHPVTSNVARGGGEFQDASLAGNYAAALKNQDRFFRCTWLCSRDTRLDEVRASLLGKCSDTVRLPPVRCRIWQARGARGDGALGPAQRLSAEPRGLAHGEKEPDNRVSSRRTARRRSIFISARRSSRARLSGSEVKRALGKATIAESTLTRARRDLAVNAIPEYLQAGQFIMRRAARKLLLHARQICA